MPLILEATVSPFKFDNDLQLVPLNKHIAECSTGQSLVIVFQPAWSPDAFDVLPTDIDERGQVVENVYSVYVQEESGVVTFPGYKATVLTPQMINHSSRVIAEMAGSREEILVSHHHQLVIVTIDMARARIATLLGLPDTNIQKAEIFGYPVEVLTYDL